MLWYIAAAWFAGVAVGTGVGGGIVYWSVRRGAFPELVVCGDTQPDMEALSAAREA